MGGIHADVQGMSLLSMHEEGCSAEFVSLTDSLGNEWSGISLNMDIVKHDENKGLKLDLLTLMLPGSSVLCCVTRLTNGTGLSYNHFRSNLNGFILPGESIRQGWVEIDGDLRTRCGQSGVEISSEGVIRIGSDSRSAILHMVNRHPGSSAWLYTNNQVIGFGESEWMQMAADETVWTAPVFFAFADEALTYKELQNLVDIRFDGNGR